ncbi:YolD-like family protein [Anaerobacillus alkalilacustris]|uniref:YolD-like family protein n=1 Tax=Anaerobacillus alkalilacustris TaxID=393763 RepID=UPI000A048405|nr:YolD-like family protein [Anaerobacillus alkalilacustris]
MRTIIKDRGNIKWTSMMLPEHVTMLRELKESSNYKYKPVLDEQQLEELNGIICYAIDTKTPVRITYFRDYDFKNVIGVIRHFDIALQSIRIVNEENFYLKLAIKDIINAKIIE